MMPFGTGQRACPGASMAMQFIKDFLAPLVHEFEWTAAALSTVGEEGSGSADGGGVDMTELYGFITMMKSPLRAYITPCPCLGRDASTMARHGHGPLQWPAWGWHSLELLDGAPPPPADRWI